MNVSFYFASANRALAVVQQYLNNVLIAFGAVLMTLLVSATVHAAAAQWAAPAVEEGGESEAAHPAVASTGSALTDSPCPGTPAAPRSIADAERKILKPGATGADIQDVLNLPEVKTYLRALDQRSRYDWAGLCQYAEDNAALKRAPRVVPNFIATRPTETGLAQRQANGPLSRK